MAYLKIRCQSCGGSWEVYRMTLDRGNQCPHCGAKICRETWKDYVAPMLDMMNTAAVALRLDHCTYHRPLFTFTAVDDSLFHNAGGDDG